LSLWVIEKTDGRTVGWAWFIGYTGDGFYRSKDPTNSIKVLKEHIEYTINRKIQ